MSATATGDRPRRATRKPPAMETSTMAEKIGRLGALYEGLDGKVDAVETKVDAFGEKLDAHIEKSSTQHQEIKNLLLSNQVAADTRTGMWRGVRGIVAFSIAQVVAIVSTLLAIVWAKHY